MGKNVIFAPSLRQVYFPDDAELLYAKPKEQIGKKQTDPIH